MTDAESNTPSEEHDPSIEIQPDYEDYGLHEQESATTIIRIDHETSLFERVGKVEFRSAGVVLKKHTRLTDEISGDTVEVYQPVQFVSDRTDEFEKQLWKGVIELIYEGKVAEEVAEELCTELVENISR